MILPRTKAGKALLEQEAYNSRSFTLISAEAIIAIEEEAISGLRKQTAAERQTEPWSPALPSNVKTEAPAFCSYEGEKLVIKTFHRFSGYDMYTGKKYPDKEEVRLICPVNPEYHFQWLVYEVSGRKYWGRM